MTTAIVLDLLIVGVMVVFLALGWSRGLFRSLGELVVLVLALLLAHEAAAFGAPQLVDRALRPVTHTAIEEQVDLLLQENTPQLSQMEEMERIIEALPGDFIREKARDILTALQLSLEEKVAYSARDTLVDTGLQVADRVLDTAVVSVVFTVLYLLSFLLTELVLKCILRALDLTMRLPILRQVNQVGGLLFGLVKGGAIVWLGVWTMVNLGLVIDQQVVDQSMLLERILRWTGITGIPPA